MRTNEVSWTLVVTLALLAFLVIGWSGLHRPTVNVDKINRQAPTADEIHVAPATEGWAIRPVRLPFLVVSGGAGPFHGRPAWWSGSDWKIAAFRGGEELFSEWVTSRKARKQDALIRGLSQRYGTQFRRQWLIAHSCRPVVATDTAALELGLAPTGELAQAVYLFEDVESVQTPHGAGNWAGRPCIGHAMVVRPLR